MDTGRGASHTGSVVGGPREGQGVWGGRGGTTWGEMPDGGDWGMKAANHIAMCVPMQKSCIICTGTPEPKYNKKNK